MRQLAPRGDTGGGDAAVLVGAEDDDSPLLMMYSLSPASPCSKTVSPSAKSSKLRRPRSELRVSAVSSPRTSRSIMSRRALGPREHLAQVRQLGHEGLAADEHLGRPLPPSPPRRARR